ncbi:MAG: hypothetical protein HC836_42620 [Richelia sp. RM2_1_2]|nr:hypothetical protein [Richelia sp. RM2_1_2]
MTTIKAVRATINLGDIELDVFQLPDSEYRLSQTQVEQAVEKPERSFRGFLASKAPEALPWKHIKLEKLAIEGNNVKVSAIPLGLTIAYWKCEARKGSQKARKLLEAIGKNPSPPFEDFGGTYVIYSKIEDKALPKRKKRLVKHSEAWYVKRLQKELGGQKEVPTPAGNIDLLTSEQLIEVKEINAWKCAVGQVEVYGDYYPSHQKRIHLFGKCHEKFLDIVCLHCIKRGILVTWES